MVLFRFPGTRHDRHTGIQQIFPCHVQIGMSASEDSRKETLQPPLILSKVSLNRVRVSLSILRIAFCRVPEPLQIFILFVEIDFPFRLRLVFVNRSQINRAQALYAVPSFSKACSHSASVSESGNWLMTASSSKFASVSCTTKALS